MAIYIVKSWYKKGDNEPIWVPKTWSGSEDIDGENVWTNGTDIFYSRQSVQLVLDRSTSTWSTRSWGGYPPQSSKFYGKNIWRTSTGVYHSNGTSHQTLNGLIWGSKTWYTLKDFYGYNVWDDIATGRVYQSAYTESKASFYLEDEASGSWQGTSMYFDNTEKYFYGQYVWNDGTDMYYSSYEDQYEFTNPSRYKWTSKTWNNIPKYPNSSTPYFLGSNVWKDNNGDVYYSDVYGNYVGIYQYKLNKDTSTWEEVNWGGDYIPHWGRYVWTDGINTYYSRIAGTAHENYVLTK